MSKIERALSYFPVAATRTVWSVERVYCILLLVFNTFLRLTLHFEVEKTKEKQKRINYLWHFPAKFSKRLS